MVNYPAETQGFNRLHLGHLEDAFIQSDLQVHFSGERETTLYRCRYSKDVHSNKFHAIPRIQQR